MLDREAGRLTGPDGEEVRLRPQAFKMLEVLVTAAPRILSQEELLDRVWGVEHLSPASVKQAVSEVRLALGDDPARPAVIETVHRRGYRCIARVAAVTPIAAVTEPEPARQTRQTEWETRPITVVVPAPPQPPIAVPVPPRRGWRLALVLLVTLLGGLSALALVRRPQPRAKPLPAPSGPPARAAARPAEGPLAVDEDGEEGGSREEPSGPGPAGRRTSLLIPTPRTAPCGPAPRGRSAPRPGSLP